jgi:hypothetical protein
MPSSLPADDRYVALGQVEDALGVGRLIAPEEQPG